MITYPAEFIVLVCFMLAGEIIIGLSLNLFIMNKWFKERKKLGNKNRKNGNNFIVTLKVIDLAICATVIPFSFAVLIVDSDHNFVVCVLKEGLVMFASSGSSFSVLLISVDRYVAVVLPTKHLLTPLRIIVCRMCVAITALCGLALPSLCLVMGSYNEAKAYSADILPCRHVLWVFRPYYFYELYYILLFAIAAITTFLCYRSVLHVIRRRLLLRTTTVTSTSADNDNTNIERFRRQEYKATRIAFAVVVTFLVCWGPHVIITIVQFISPESLAIDMVQTFCLVIAFLAPIIHPVLYTYETGDQRPPSIVSTLPLCGRCLTRGSRVTPEQTNAESCEHNNVKSLTLTKSCTYHSSHTNCNTSALSEQYV